MNTEDSPTIENRGPMRSLIGRALSAVVFVQDYLQLQFDGDLLTILAWPTIRVAENVLSFGHPNYRDALCERISAVVVEVDVQPEQQVTIEFADASTIVVPINNAAPEVLIYTPENGPTWAC